MTALPHCLSLLWVLAKVTQVLSVPRIVSRVDEGNLCCEDLGIARRGCDQRSSGHGLGMVVGKALRERQQQHIGLRVESILHLLSGDTVMQFMQSSSRFLTCCFRPQSTTKTVHPASALGRLQHRLDTLALGLEGNEQRAHSLGCSPAVELGWDRIGQMWSLLTSVMVANSASILD